MFMNRNLLRLMILMKLKRKKLRSGLKTKEKRREVAENNKLLKKKEKTRGRSG